MFTVALIDQSLKVTVALNAIPVTWRRPALCWIVWHNVHSPQNTYVITSYRSNRLGLSHWHPYAVHRGSCLELYYCNMVEWFWWDSSLSMRTNWFPSVLWHCWFGHVACKNCPRNDLLCVERDVKPYTLTHSPRNNLKDRHSNTWRPTYTAVVCEQITIVLIIPWVVRKELTVFCCSYEATRNDSEPDVDEMHLHYLLTTIMLRKFVICPAEANCSLQLKHSVTWYA